MMRRNAPRPFGQSMPFVRLASMIMALVVIWALYQRLKDPATWRILVEDATTSTTATVAKSPSEPEPEQLVLGPNDRDIEEFKAAEDLFEFIVDRAPLKSREMEAYWRLMDWSRTEPFSELEHRAKQDVPFTQLWEQPELNRGKLIRLRLHVRRVLQYDAPENPSNIPKVCEAWGWTDESRSFPYVIVFPDPPKDLPIGTDIRAEVVFVGYFLKVMTYTAFDHARGAPLLVGRIQMVKTQTPIASTPSNPYTNGLIIAAGIACVSIAVWAGSRKRKQPASLPQSLPDVSIGEKTAESPFAGVSTSTAQPTEQDSPFANLG